MIKMIRLDERMIHGQVAIKWSRLLSVDRIIVANDNAASNDIVKKSLMMAAPATAKVAIKSVQDAIELMKNPKASEHDILLIVANPQDLLSMVENVDGIPKVNIGNYGKILEGGTNGRTKYSVNLYCNEEEANMLRKVVATKIPASIQVLPDDVPEPLEKVLK